MPLTFDAVNPIEVLFRSCFDVAHCSDEATFITGSDYPIDGGFFNLHG
jgi:hypothetical protein